LFPGVRRHAFHLPHALVTFALGLAAIVATLLGWALFAPSNAGNEPVLPSGRDVGAIRSIAYILPGESGHRDFDDLVVTEPGAGRAPQVIATFPNSGATGFHARGATSPLGEALAILWLPSFTTRANLTITDVQTRESRQVEGSFDYFSALAWAPDGTRLALASTVDTPDGRAAAVLEIDTATLHATPVAEFPNAFAVVPVGYSFEGTRLYVVVVDQKGSNLFVERGGKVELVAELSPGRTRDWALSPDGSRLAFIDILGGGSRTYVGRTLTVATGAIATLPAEKNQLGATWRPGSPVAEFGGPGGSWQLSDPTAEAAYLVPAAWSPNGAYLVATVYSAGSDRDAQPSAALELISTETTTLSSMRTLISGSPGTSFVGWVRNLN
jgi:hypothetical protein